MHHTGYYRGTEKTKDLVKVSGEARNTSQVSRVLAQCMARLRKATWLHQHPTSPAASSLLLLQRAFQIRIGRGEKTPVLFGLEAFPSAQGAPWEEAQKKVLAREAGNQAGYCRQSAGSGQARCKIIGQRADLSKTRISGDCSV